LPPLFIQKTRIAGDGFLPTRCPSSDLTPKQYCKNTEGADYTRLPAIIYN